jgi:hypothetical protein
MKMMKKYILLFIFFLLGNVAYAANAWLNDVKIVQLGTYQDSPVHFVWTSLGTIPECAAVSQNPVLNFSEESKGGKSLVAVLTAAIVATRNVAIQVDGCKIIEVYLR